MHLFPAVTFAESQLISKSIFKSRNKSGEISSLSILSTYKILAERKNVIVTGNIYRYFKIMIYILIFDKIILAIIRAICYDIVIVSRFADKQSQFTELILKITSFVSCVQFTASRR